MGRMPMTELNTKADLRWLAETHLRDHAATLRLGRGKRSSPWVVAALYGNEDCPVRIDLYSEDLYNAPVLRFELDTTGGHYVCRGVVRYNPETGMAPETR